MREALGVLGLILLFLPPARAADDAETTYKTQCLKCHGATGDGAGRAGMKIKPADLRSGAVQKLSDEELYKTIAFGVGHKQYPHAFAERGLNAKQIAEVVTYIRKFGKAPKNEK